MRTTSWIQKIVRWICDVIVVVALAWFVVHAFLSQTIVNGHSMEPRLKAGDVLLVDRLSYQLFAPRRMDVVVFKKSDGSESIKRIVGLPGESLLIQNGRLYIDGKLLDAPEISPITLPGIAENTVELPENEYFLIGDYADASEDSRFANVGNVRAEQLMGRIWMRIYPLRRIAPVR